jgi:hypothetical protein
VTIRIWEQPVSGSQPDSKLALAQQSEEDLAQSGGKSAQSEGDLAQSEGNSGQQSKEGKLQEYVI